MSHSPSDEPRPRSDETAVGRTEGAHRLAPSDEPRPRLDETGRAPQPDPPGGWAESPWIWLGMFAAVGLLALLVVMPKYAQRQGRLEQRYQHRIEVAQRLATEVPTSAAPESAAETTDGLAESLEPAASAPLDGGASLNDGASLDDGAAHRMDRGRPRAVLTPLVVLLAGVLAGAILTLVWVTASRSRHA